MHPIKNVVTGKEEDLTPKVVEHLNSIISETKKALSLVNCDCPYALEAQMSQILTHVREATHSVSTAANYYDWGVPVTAWKKEQVDACHEKRAKLNNSNARDILDNYMRLYKVETGKSLCNCIPGAYSAGDFALWLVEKFDNRKES